ncbi:MAG: helicase, partial [Bacteroidetes bacterium]|nr:helicase [Bacteroidota bacterium]
MTTQELTFIEAARIYRAYASEKPKKLHGLHHDQIKAAIDLFKEEIKVHTLTERASAKLGPNEQKAMAFVKDASRQEFASESEKELLDLTKLAIRRGRFQKLPRELNKLLRQVKKEGMPRVDAFRRLIIILNGYPIVEKFHEEVWDDTGLEIKKKFVKGSDLPEIIISESFI